MYKYSIECKQLVCVCVCVCVCLCVYIYKVRNLSITKFSRRVLVCLGPAMHLSAFFTL
jgi:hypothetical protein